MNSATRLGLILVFAGALSEVVGGERFHGFFDPRWAMTRYQSSSEWIKVILSRLTLMVGVLVAAASLVL